jgi:hypothetical protein
MSKQFENQNEVKLEKHTEINKTTEQKIEQVADTASEQASKTENNYDKDHTIISH